MNNQILVGAGVVLLGATLIVRDRRLKAKFRGCRHCGRTPKRTFKMYPIVGDSRRGTISVPPIVIKNGRVPFAVYKFSECLHCGQFAMVESYDNNYTLASLRHRVHNQPQAFVHDPNLFKRANLTPCTTLNLSFDTAVLGEPTFEERYFGFRLPWRSQLRQVSFS